MRGVYAAVVMALLASLCLSGAVAAQPPPTHAPATLMLAMLPSQLPADGQTYPALVISLVDSAGAPTVSLTNVLVFLSTTNATVAHVPQTATIPAGHAFLQVGIQTTLSPGSTTIGATSQGLASSQVQATTVRVSSGPASLTLSLAPGNTVQALGGSDDAYVVQLKNSAGQPAASSQSTSLVITSSNSTLIPGTISATIPAGSDLIYGTLTPEAPGTTTLTALAPNLATGTAHLSLNPSEESIALSFSPTTIAAGSTASVMVAVTVLGMPVQGANVTLTTELGSFSAAFGPTGADGQFSSTYVSVNPGVALVNATASSPVIGTLTTVQPLVITTLSISTTTPTAQSTPGFSLVTGLLPILVVIAVVVIALVLVRSTLRKRRGTLEDEFSAEEAKA